MFGVNPKDMLCRDLVIPDPGNVLQECNLPQSLQWFGQISTQHEQSPWSGLRSSEMLKLELGLRCEKCYMSAPVWHSLRQKVRTFVKLNIQLLRVPRRCKNDFVEC